MQRPVQVDSPGRSWAGERVLVIYGSGHKALLDAFVDGAPNIEWVEPLDYLAPDAGDNSR